VLVRISRHSPRRAIASIIGELGLRRRLGAAVIALVISSPQNLRRLDYTGPVNGGLADPRSVPHQSAPRATPLQNGKAIVLITFSIHSTRSVDTSRRWRWPYRLATDTERDDAAILDNVILGWCRRLNRTASPSCRSGKPHASARPGRDIAAGVVSPHTGHDNNRDWYAFTQVETQLTVDSLYNVWHPQIVHESIKWMANGARLFLPPTSIPSSPRRPVLIDGVNALGSAMAWGARRVRARRDLDQFDLYAWTPGVPYQHYHGGVRISPRRRAPTSRRRSISVRSGCRRASAATIRASGRGISRIPGAGDGWSLRDIVSYQMEGAYALLAHAAPIASAGSRILQYRDTGGPRWREWPYAT